MSSSGRRREAGQLRARVRMMHDRGDRDVARTRRCAAGISRVATLATLAALAAFAGAAPAAELAYVGNQGDGTVSVIDTDSDKVIRLLPDRDKIGTKVQAVVPD